MFEKTRGKIALLNMGLAAKKVFTWFTTKREDKAMGYSVVTGLYKAFMVWAGISGSLLVSQSGLDKITLPDTYSDFASNWANIVVPLVMALAKFGINYYKVNIKKTTT